MSTTPAPAAPAPPRSLLGGLQAALDGEAGPGRGLEEAALLLQPTLSLAGNPLLFERSPLELVAAQLARRAASPDLSGLDLSGTRLNARLLAALAPALAPDAAASALERLSLRNNDLQRAEDLAPLAALAAARLLPRLYSLDLAGNALCRQAGWRARVLQQLPDLLLLDGEPAALFAACEAAAADNAPGPGLAAAEARVNAGSHVRRAWVEKEERRGDCDADWERAAGEAERSLRARLREAVGETTED